MKRAPAAAEAAEGAPSGAPPVPGRAGADRAGPGCAGAVQRVTFAGELDLATAVSMLDAVRAALRGRPSTLELDLSAVAFIDVAGLRALIACRRMAVAHDARLALVEPSDAVRRLVDIVGLAASFGLTAEHRADSDLARRARRLAAGE